MYFIYLKAKNVVFYLICFNPQIVNIGMDKCFFIDGPLVLSGTGKTFLYNTLMHTLRADGGVLIPVAFTGIAVDLLKGGKMVHSQFQ